MYHADVPAHINNLYERRIDNQINFELQSSNPTFPHTTHPATTMFNA